MGETYKYLFTEECDVAEEEIQNKAAELAYLIEERQARYQQETAIANKALELKELIDAYKMRFQHTDKEDVQSINAKAEVLAHMISQYDRRVKEDCGFEESAGECWMSKLTALILEYHSLDTGLEDVLRHEEIIDEILQTMEDEIIQSHLQEGTLPEKIAEFSSKEFNAMKKTLA